MTTRYVTFRGACVSCRRLREATFEEAVNGPSSYDLNGRHDLSPIRYLRLRCDQCGASSIYEREGTL